MRLQEILTSQLLLPSVFRTQIDSSPLPVVDLGYELYRASEFNANGFYNFSNIRYARPPLGDLRFKAPERPVVDRSTVKDEQTGKMCPQATPTWAPTPLKPSPTRNPQENEDCLFLDVFVPQKVFNKMGRGPGAPVFVWIHGGGYVQGSKAFYNDPTGLLLRSQKKGSDGMIYVAMNYRLGAFGWLSGPSMQQNGLANAGLYDQRMALEWVQSYIHLFGGDKNRVTVAGISAGGGSIIHQLTAFGGNSSSLFQRAIPQSPAWLPLPSVSRQEQLFQDFLQDAKVSSLGELRKASSKVLMDLNAAKVAASSHGQFTFGPATDGDFITQDPKLLLSHGRFRADVEIMTGYNSNEGLGFVPANLTSDLDYDMFLKNFFPDAGVKALSHISEVLYPPVSKSTTYDTNKARMARTIADAVINCNTVTLNHAFRNQTFAYLFAVSPGAHGQDFPYTYYNPNKASPATDVNSTVAFTLQDYMVGFAMNGTPTTTVPRVPKIVPYGSNASIFKLDSNGMSIIQDPAANDRCSWWALGLFY